MTNEEKRMMIVKAAHELVEAERYEAASLEYSEKENWEKAAAEVERANEAFNAACDAVFGAVQVAGDVR